MKERVLSPGENALLFDLDAVKDEPVRVIGTSARIFSLEETEKGYFIRCKAASDITVHMRLKLNKPVCSASATDETGSSISVECTWDKDTSTVLLAFESTNSVTEIDLETV